MARSFNLTAEINLRAPGNLKTVVAEIRRELGTVSANVNLKLDAKAAKSVSAVKSRLDAVNSVLVTARNNTDALNSSLQNLSSALTSVGSAGARGAGSIKVTADSAKSAAENLKVAASGMEEFGKQSFLAVKRFAAFSFVTSGIYGLVNAINSGFAAFIKFDRELVRLQQVTGKSSSELRVLEKVITDLSINLGISSESLTQVAVTLAQAGLTANETKVALAALAKTELAPSFDNLAETTEGAIAVLRQFDLQASDLEAALGSVNAVAAAFAVEADDLIAAIQRTGGVFANASKGVSQGTDALNEFLALFTSVRQTTRESAETIATGLRTIFTRIQRAKTIDQLREFGIELTDLEGKFVGPFEAVRRLSEGLKTLDPRDLRFSSIVEELGGFRQIGKVIPLIQQFAVAQEALKVAQRGQGSLADAQVIAQKSLANQLAKVREQFLAFIRDVGKSEVFQSLFKIVLNLTSGLISLASAFKPILPILAIVGAIKGVKAVGDFATGFFGAASKGSSRGAGESLGSTISGAKDKERADATAKASDAIKANTSALNSLTSAVQALTAKIGSGGGSSTLSEGGKVYGFNSGGVVPGSGKGDKIRALLEPGEVVMSNDAVNKYGRGNLVRMNKNIVRGKTKKYTWGGKISTLAEIYPSIENAFGYEDISNQIIKDSSKFVPITPNEKQIKEFQGMSGPYGIRFEKILAKYYGLSSYEEKGKWDYLDFPSARAEAKFMSKGDTYDDGDGKGNTAKTIAAKNYLFENSLRSPNKPNARVTELWPDIQELPSATVYYPKNPKDFFQKFAIGGKIQKFMAGSPGGIRVASGKGRGVKRSKGARGPAYDIPSTENFVEWAKGIYSEYDADPSLVTASYMGMSMPAEIAYANMLLAKFLEKGGSGLSTGKKFIVTPPDRIDDALRPYLVPNPNNPEELGFFGDDAILAFQRANKTELELSEDQKRADELSKRKTTSKMQRELLGFALEGVAKSVRDKTLTEEQLEILSPEVLAELSRDPQSQVFSLPKLRNEVAPASSSLLDSIGGSLSEFRKSGGQTSLAGVIPVGAGAKIKAAIPAYIESMKDEAQKAAKAKTALKYFDSFVGGSTAEKPGHATAFVETINQMLKSGVIQGLAKGGMVQKFPIGGAVKPAGPLSEDILRRLKKLGGAGPIKQAVGLDYINQQIREKLADRRISAKQLLNPSSLSSISDSAALLPAITPILAKAEDIQKKKDEAKRDQIARNLQAASGGAYQFGLASIYGPNGELGYSSVGNAQEIEGNDGQKYLTQIVRKSLPSRYEGAIKATREDIAGLSQRAGERFQYADIFGTGGPLAFDFDETLVKGADIFTDKGQIDFLGYNDTDKVQKALANAELTLLGKELQKRLSEYPQLMDNIRVLTARPPSNAPYLASTLSRLELPIPQNKITGVSGGLNKVNNLSELETLIDDNLENIQSVLAGGKKAIPYKESKMMDISNSSSYRALAATEGYALEEMVRNWGVNVGSDDDNDPLKPIDFPKGLGVYASKWDMPPTIPTDTKRTNSSTAASIMLDRAKKFYVENFAFGGKADSSGFEEIRKKIMDKYPEIDFRISKRKSGFGYMIQGGLSPDQRSQVNFASNLTDLSTVSDKMAQDILYNYGPNIDPSLLKKLQKKKFAVGGLADATEEMSGLMKGLYGDRSSENQQPQKKEKQFGKIALRSDGSDITATYFKQGANALLAGAEMRSGQVTASKIDSDLYAVRLSAATKGYGPRLYDTVMEAATENGAMLTSDRNSVSGDAKKVWEYYFNNRGDVKKTPLKPANWTKNQANIDPKLYGSEDTWPPATDPAWILQSGYSKSPSLINDLNSVIKINQKAQDSALTALQFFQSKSMKLAGGGAVDIYHGSNTGTNDSVLESFKKEGARSDIATGYGQGSGLYVYSGKEKAKQQASMRVKGGSGFTTVSGDTAGRPMVVSFKEILNPEAWDLDYELNKGSVVKWLTQNYDKAKQLSELDGSPVKILRKLEEDRAKGIMSSGITVQEQDQKLISDTGEAMIVKGGARKSLYSGTSGDIREGELVGKLMGHLQAKDSKFVYAFENEFFSSPSLLSGGWDDLALKYTGATPLKPTNIETFAQGGLINRLASGGNVPAMVSNGEAFVPPKVAKKIGYAKLDKMNQADRNGMRGFASGGISVFKGPGSGTSDSIGPIGLPTGSYVIREKATKALGLSRGGSVGSLQRFALGGTPQDQDYFSIKAKQAGQSIDQFAKTLVYAAKDLAKDLKGALKVAQTELKTGIIEVADDVKNLKGIKDKDQRKAAAEDIINKLVNKIQATDPKKGDKEARAIAISIAKGLASGGSYEDLIASNKELEALMGKTLSDSEAQTEALRKIAAEKGLSPAIIERLLGDRTRGNQDNGLSRIIDFFGGPLKVTTRSLLLAASAFEEGAKYIYSAEKLSAETRGVLGGIRGGAQGAAVVAEMDVGNNVNQFGKFLESFGGRLGSTGQALQKFSGALQAGAIAYAAVSGAIKGFYESLNQARLEQELQKLSLATDKTAEAFRRLEKIPTDTNATLAQQALGQEMQAVEGLRRTAAVDIQGRRSLETARSWDFTGITSAVSGQNQEKDARKAFFDVSARRFEQFGTLGARRLNEVDPKEIEKAVADANKDDTVITRLAKELEDLQAAPVRDDAAIKAKQGEIDTAQQAKAENLFRKSQRFGQIAALEGEQEALRQFYINQAQTEEEKNQRLKALNGQLGDTDKERSDNQQKAIDTAKRLAAAEAETELRTKLLSDATQKLNLQTENLLRTYSVATAILQRFGESINLIKDSAGATAAALEGRAQIGNIDRTNENILGNIEAYSLEEVRGAAVQTGQLAGGGLGGQNLQNQVLTAKVLQEALPQALATTGSEDVGEVINKLEDAFSQAGVAFSEPIKEDLRNALQSEANKAQGVSFQKLAQESDVVANLLKQTEAGLKAAQEFQKRYNDALAAAIELQNGYAQALQQSIDYQIKASEIRANADIQLKETLGQRVTSADRNAAFDTRIRTLTSTNVIPGGTTDPNQIFQQLMSGVAGQRSQEEELTRRKQEFASDPTEANKARVAEQMQAMAKQNVAINNSRKALEELANDGSKAANALKDLQEIDRVATGATNFTRNVLTSSGEDLAKINKQLLAFTKFRSGNATGRDVNNLQFRQDVFAGGDLIKSVLPKELAEQLDAKISLDMLRATPGGAAALQSVVGQGPEGEPITLESALNMKAGGRDPVQERYIQAYESATRVQATAAENLGKAAMAVADTFNNKMIEVLTQIQQQLPTILEQSVTAGMTPAVAAAYKEMNVAVKERQALDATQAASMGLDSTGFNAVSTAYDAVETSKKRTEDLVLSQAKAQGFNSVEEFKTKAREKYDTVVGSDQYKASIDAQAAAKANFDTIAAGANLDPAEAFRTMTDYRTSDPYTQATTKIAEKEAAFKAAQAGPQPEKPTGTKPLEVTPADTKAKEEERQKQQAGDDESKLALAFGAHVASFAAAVAAFAVTVAASGGSGLLQRFFGRGGAGTPAVSGGAGVPRPMGAPGSIPGMGAPAAGAPAGAPGAGGGWLSLLGKAVAAAEIGRGAYVGATADTTTNRELTEGWMGETVGTGFNTLTGALTGNTGQSQLATLAGIDENASYAQGAAGNLLGTAEAAGRGAAIGYQFGGPTGALVGAIAGLAGDVTKNGALLVQAIGDVADQTQKNADAEAKNKRMEEGLRTSMNSTNAERFGEDAGAALSKLSPQEQVRAREEANLRVRLQKTEAIASTSGTDAEKLSALGEDTTRWQSIDDLLSFLRNEAATSAQYRANITTEQAGLFTSEKKRGADSPEFLSAVDALVISQEQSADNQAKTAKMADEATKPGSIYTHDIYSQKLLEQLVSLTGSSPVTSNSDSITAPDLAQKLFDPQSIVKQAQGALSGVVSTLSDPSKVVDIGGKALTDGLNMPSNMLKQVPDLMKTLLNPLELSKSITKSISDEDGKKLDINKNIAEGFSLSSLAKLIPSSLLDKLGLSTGAETTNESCECKLLAQILAVLQKCCPGGTSTVTPTSINAPIPAPVPPGVNAVPAIQQPNRPNVVPQVGVQAPAIGSGQVQAAVGLEPKPELALQQAEKAKQEIEATKPNVSDKPLAPSAPKATMTKAENMRLINLNSKGSARRSEEEENEYQTLRNKQMEANPKLKAEADTRRKIALARKGRVRRSPEEENEYQTLINKQTKQAQTESSVRQAEQTKPPAGNALADALQSKDSITSTPTKSTVTPASISIPSTIGLEPRPELALQEASKNQAVSTATQPPITGQQKTDTKPKKPLTPYEARQKAKRDSYQSQKKSRREAYLSRFRPEVREKMMTDEEKAARKSSSSQSKPAISSQDEASLSPSEKANLAALSRIPKEERSEDQQARYNALNNRNRATNPAIDAKAKAEIAQRQQEMMQAQTANFTTPVQFDDNALTLGQVDAGAATPAQTQAIARAQIGANQPQATPEQRQAAVAAMSSSPSIWNGERLVAVQTYGTDPRDIPPQDPNALRLPSQPVPTPLQTNQTPQYTAQTVSADQGASATAQQYTLSLDPASLKAFTQIQTSFTEFGKYVTQLANIKLPNQIEITGGGNYTMEVNITGAAAMEMLQTETKKLAETFVVEEIQKLKDKLNKVFPSEFKASGSGGENVKP